MMYSCPMCPIIFLNKSQLDTHKMTNHRIGRGAEASTLLDLESRKYLKVRVRDIGTKFDVECTVCGQVVKLSTYMKHQEAHLRQKALSVPQKTKFDAKKAGNIGKGRTRPKHKKDMTYGPSSNDVNPHLGSQKKFTAGTRKENHELTHNNSRNANGKTTRSNAGVSMEFKSLEAPARKRKIAPKPLLFECLFCFRRFATRANCMKHEDAPGDCSKPSPTVESVAFVTKYMEG